MFTGMQRAKPDAQCAVAHKRRSDKALRPANMWSTIKKPWR